MCPVLEAASRVSVTCKHWRRQTCSPWTGILTQIFGKRNRSIFDNLELETWRVAYPKLFEMRCSPLSFRRQRARSRARKATTRTRAKETTRREREKEEGSCATGSAPTTSPANKWGFGRMEVNVYDWMNAIIGEYISYHGSEYICSMIQNIFTKYMESKYMKCDKNQKDLLQTSKWENELLLDPILWCAQLSANMQRTISC